MVVPLRLHTKLPPVGFTVAVMVVICGGSNAANGDAFSVILGSGFTVNVAGLEKIVVHNPVICTRNVLVFIAWVTLLMV
jgi:hypothetical protein